MIVEKLSAQQICVIGGAMAVRLRAIGARVHPHRGAGRSGTIRIRAGKQAEASFSRLAAATPLDVLCCRKK